MKDLAPAVSAAFTALEPGKTTREPVRSPEGFHIVHKDRTSDDQIERAYRKAKAPEVAKKLAEELLGRLKSDAASRAAIAEAVEAVLGERGVNDANRPNAQIVERARIDQIRLTAAAKAALETFARSAHPGDVLPSPPSMATRSSSHERSARRRCALDASRLSLFPRRRPKESRAREAPQRRTRRKERDLSHALFLRLPFHNQNPRLEVFSMLLLSRMQDGNAFCRASIHRRVKERLNASPKGIVP